MKGWDVRRVSGSEDEVRCPQHRRERCGQGLGFQEGVEMGLGSMPGFRFSAARVFFARVAFRGVPLGRPLACLFRWQELWRVP